MTPTEHTLLELAAAVGSISESNGHFTDRLARAIDTLGKTPAELTLGELAALIERERHAYNALETL